jgi:hypothetical protein
MPMELAQVESDAFAAAKPALVNGYAWLERIGGVLRVNYSKGRNSEPRKPIGFSYFWNHTPVGRDAAEAYLKGE